jgi:hypothetical protein
MKRIFLGPGTSGESWVQNGLQMIERWINTLVAFTGAAADRDGSDGIVPQPFKGDQDKVLHGDGKWRTPASGGGGSGGDTGTPGSIPIFGTDGTITDDGDEFTYDPDNNILYAQYVVVEDAPFDDSWDGDPSVPTKNAIHDLVADVTAAQVQSFHTPFSKNIGKPPVGTYYYDVLVPGFTITSPDQAVWLIGTIASGAALPKSSAGKVVTHTMQLHVRRGTPGNYTYIQFGQISHPYYRNKPKSYEDSLIGARSGFTVGDYDIVVRSSTDTSRYALHIGEITVNVLGMILS